MVSIALCDDDVDMLEQERKGIELIAVEAGVPATIRTFKNAQEFFFSPPERLDMLVTDIEMPQVGGLELATKVRRN